jgi:putative FmdB family regulatory protein
MPTYEYRCKNCSHQFDIIQSFADDALTVCPACSEATLKKVFGNVGITFKGSGFYKTDSRSAGSFGSTRDSDKSDNGTSATKKSDSSTSSSSSSSSSDGGSSSSGSNGSSSSSSSSNGSSTSSSTSSSTTSSKPA